MKLILTNKYLHYSCIILAAALFITPAFIRGAGGGDFVYHLLWAENFSDQFWQGDFYPRWLVNMNAGAGSPVFFFYPPVAYYFASLFKFVQSGTPEGWRQICCAAFLAISIGGIFIYKWLHACFNDRLAAFCGALVYFFMPYTILVFHIFLTFAEFFVFAWVPAMLYYAKMLADGKRSAVTGYAVAFALLIMSSIPGAIVAAGLPVLYYIFCIKGDYKKIIPFMTAIVLGIGLAAIYWMPMVFERVNVMIGNNGAMWEGRFDYSRNFIFFPHNHEEGAFVYLIVQLTTSMLLCFLSYKLLIKIKKSDVHSEYKKSAIFWFGIIVLALFMMSQLSKPVWQIIPVLQLIQFPRRFGSYETFAFPAIIATYFVFLKNSNKNMKAEFIWLLCCLGMSYILSLSFSMAQKKDFSPLGADMQINASDSYYEKNHKWQLLYYSKNTTITHEYLPIRVDENFLAPENFENFTAVYSTKALVTKGEAEIVISRWEAGNIELGINGKSATEIKVGQLYYPYWLAEDQSGEKYQIIPTEESGLIKLAIPAGEHKIRLYLDKPLSQRYGEIISLISLLLAGGYGMLVFCYRKKL